ncbi:MAG: hypothetical protein KDA63_10360 [Planctomycetales bacterium]|nr:hypothetical protein [Planctomycetales bacterium]
MGSARRAADRPAPNRTSAAGGGSPPPSPSVDPRKALAEKMMRQARERIEAESAEPQRPARRSRAHDAGGGVTLAIDPVVFVHVVLAIVALTIAALAVLFCYHMLYVMFTLGRILALPTGVLTAAVLSYLSVCFLGVVESTAAGRISLDDHVTGDWREWFWTLPSTAGPLVWAGFLAWLATLPLVDQRAMAAAVIAWALYPVLQLSVLECEQPLLPVSLPTLRSLVTRPAAWLVFYFCSIVPVAVPALVAWAAFVDPPYVTVLVTAPVAALAMFAYAWLFGHLTREVSKEFPRD